MLNVRENTCNVQPHGSTSAALTNNVIA